VSSATETRGATIRRLDDLVDPTLAGREAPGEMTTRINGVERPGSSSLVTLVS
jgi:hypothetical protein